MTFDRDGQENGSDCEPVARGATPMQIFWGSRRFALFVQTLAVSLVAALLLLVTSGESKVWRDDFPISSLRNWYIGWTTQVHMPSDEVEVGERDIASEALSDDQMRRLLLDLPEGGVAASAMVDGPGQGKGRIDAVLCPSGDRHVRWRSDYSHLVQAPQDGPLPVVQREIVFTQQGTFGNPEAVDLVDWARLIPSQPAIVRELLAVYRTMAPLQREVASRQVLRFRREQARLRKQLMGETKVVAGETCSVTRWGSQVLCIWEATGLVLQYDGPSFSFVVDKIARPASSDPSLCRGTKGLVAFVEPVAPESCLAGEFSQCEEPSGRQAIVEKVWESVLSGNFAPLALALVGEDDLVANNAGAHAL